MRGSPTTWSGSQVACLGGLYTQAISISDIAQGTFEIASPASSSSLLCLRLPCSLRPLRRPHSSVPSELKAQLPMLSSGTRASTPLIGEVDGIQKKLAELGEAAEEVRDTGCGSGSKWSGDSIVDTECLKQ